LVEASTGATLALLAVEKENAAKRVSVVAGVAPYADVKTILGIATTGNYQKTGNSSATRLTPSSPAPSPSP
jgi:hypothetical protein